MKLTTMNIFIEMDSTLKLIDNDNYESYNDIFFKMLSDINNTKIKTIFILQNEESMDVIKKYFHDDIFDFFDIKVIKDKKDISNILIEKKIDIYSSLCILTTEKFLKLFKELDIYTTFLTYDNLEIISKDIIKLIDYKKIYFNNLIDINFQNLIFECNKYYMNIKDKKYDDKI
ncbi:MAG: hypothetical protein ACRDCG_01060 [Mycoplasmoidaceae bacterium]